MLPSSAELALLRRQSQPEMAEDQASTEAESCARAGEPRLAARDQACVGAQELVQKRSVAHAQPRGSVSVKTR